MCLKTLALGLTATIDCFILLASLLYDYFAQLAPIFVANLNYLQSRDLLESLSLFWDISIAFTF